jgi:hypothetical protein
MSCLNRRSSAIMPNYKSDPIFLHPILHAGLPAILAEIKKHLPAGWNTGVDSQGVHRTPAMVARNQPKEVSRPACLCARQFEQCVIGGGERV